MTLGEQMRLRREMQEAQDLGESHLTRGDTPKAMAEFERARSIRLKLMRHLRGRYGRPGR